MKAAAAAQRELERQQRLLQSIQSPGSRFLLEGWVADHVGGTKAAPAGGGAVPASAQRGLAAYVAHAGATAERALAASYPTVQALVGDEAFALLARALWRKHPPVKGDLAWFGESLSTFIVGDEQLADVPYLSDVARLDWALTRAESAADREADIASFRWLTEVDPQELVAVLAPGAALIASPWPVVTLWQAHRTPSSQGDDPFATAREALHNEVSETAWVWRSGWQACARGVSPGEASFLQALCEEASLSQALNEAGEAFDFASCLQQGLEQRWWLGLRRH